MDRERGLLRARERERGRDLRAGPPRDQRAGAPRAGAREPQPGCKKTTSLLYKMEMDFGDLQIIGLSRIFIQIIGLSLFSPDYRISTREC